MAKCKYCGKNVTWMQEGRKKVPVEDDGGKHECDEYKKSVGSLRAIDPSAIDPEILKQYQENMKNSKTYKKKSRD